MLLWLLLSMLHTRRQRRHFQIGTLPERECLWDLLLVLYMPAVLSGVLLSRQANPPRHQESLSPGGAGRGHGMLRR